VRCPWRVEKTPAEAGDSACVGVGAAGVLAKGERSRQILSPRGKKYLASRGGQRHKLAKGACQHEPGGDRQGKRQ